MHHTVTERTFLQLHAQWPLPAKWLYDNNDGDKCITYNLAQFSKFMI